MSIAASHLSASKSSGEVGLDSAASSRAGNSLTRLSRKSQSQEGGAPATTPTEDIPFWVGWLVVGWIKNLPLLPFLAIAIIMLWRSGIWERQVIQSELADEIGPLVTPEEYEAIQGDRSFKTRRIPGYSRRASAAIVKAQNELAFRKWRVKQLGQPTETDPLVLSWREQLIRLRGSEALAVS